jgi:ornithine cyclodeaminase
MRIKIFSAEEIRRLISMPEAIEIVKEAFIQLSAKKAQCPVRTSLRINEEGNVALIMPAFLEKNRALGTKLVTVFPLNQRKGLPSTQALVLLVDAENGTPQAIYEGTFLTRLRTGAATGAATQMLSRPDSQTLALFGAGGQALFQILAVLAVREIKEIRIFDLSIPQMESLLVELTQSLGARQPRIVKSLSPEEALVGADIIVTATTSFTPVFPGSRLPAGAHINAIGAFKPEMQEVDEETIRRARIFVDSMETCLEEAGDLIIPLEKGLIRREDIQGEIGEVASGKKMGRKTRQEITYFKSVGSAIQDISVAQAIFRKSQENDTGIKIEL